MPAKKYVVDLTPEERDRLGALLKRGKVGARVSARARILLHAADGAAVRHVNVGGRHHRPGRVQRLPYGFLTEEEAGQLRDLARAA